MSCSPFELFFKALLVLCRQLRFQRGIDGDLLDQVQGPVAEHEFEKVEEWFLDIVVRLRAHFNICDVFLTVKSYLLGFHFSVLHINLVSDQDDGNVPSNSDEITVPNRRFFVRVTGCDIEEEKCTRGVDVIAVSQSSELLLPGCIPDLTVDSSG